MQAVGARLPATTPNRPRKASRYAEILMFISPVRMLYKECLGRLVNELTALKVKSNSYNRCHRWSELREDASCSQGASA
jgi:hypothetical protein